LPTEKPPLCNWGSVSVGLANARQCTDIGARSRLVDVALLPATM
jgi:hypothetical protein